MYLGYRLLTLSTRVFAQRLAYGKSPVLPVKPTEVRACVLTYGSDASLHLDPGERTSPFGH